METLIGTVGQWLGYGLIIGVLLLMFIMLMRGSKATCCKTEHNWYDRPPIDFQALRGTVKDGTTDTQSETPEAISGRH